MSRFFLFISIFHCVALSLLSCYSVFMQPQQAAQTPTARAGYLHILVIKINKLYVFLPGSGRTGHEHDQVRVEGLYEWLWMGGRVVKGGSSNQECCKVELEEVFSDCHFGLSKLLYFSSIERVRNRVYSRRPPAAPH